MGVRRVACFAGRALDGVLTSALIGVPGIFGKRVLGGVLLGGVQWGSCFVGVAFGSCFEGVGLGNVRGFWQTFDWVACIGRWF